MKKTCKNCHEEKDISEFSLRKYKKGSEIKHYYCGTCKDCIRKRGREYYHNNKKNVKYVYRFLNKYDEIIYIGKTENLVIRLNNHFSNGHLPQECYDETVKIEFLAMISTVLMDIKEIYYINLYKPKYNTEYIVNEEPIIIKDFKYDIWEEYDKEKVKELTKDNLFKKLINMFEPSRIKSIFNRKRGYRYYVYLEYLDLDGKKKQIQINSFKNETDSINLVNKLKKKYDKI